MGHQLKFIMKKFKYMFTWFTDVQLICFFNQIKGLLIPLAERHCLVVLYRGPRFGFWFLCLLPRLVEPEIAIQEISSFLPWGEVSLVLQHLAPRFKAQHWWSLNGFLVNPSVPKQLLWFGIEGGKFGRGVLGDTVRDMKGALGKMGLLGSIWSVQLGINLVF